MTDNTPRPRVRLTPAEKVARAAARILDSLGEDVIQNRMGQICFVFAMAAQQTFHHRGQRFHFANGSGASHNSFNLIEHLAEN